jgi:hypothetical protein
MNNNHNFIIHKKEGIIFVGFVIDLDISISNQREKKIKKKYEFIKIL